jgi:hypothetical protein
VLPSLLSRHVEANTGPSKTHFGVLSMRAMPIAVTGIPNLIFLQIQICFWWTCRGSNPGPQRLRFEGITTITYFLLLAPRLAIVFKLFGLGFLGPFKILLIRLAPIITTFMLKRDRWLPQCPSHHDRPLTYPKYYVSLLPATYYLIQWYKNLCSYTIIHFFCNDVKC